LETPNVVLVSARPEDPEILLQHVPEPKIGKNRMHLDMRVDHLEAEVERLTRWGPASFRRIRSSKKDSAGS